MSTVTETSGTPAIKARVLGDRVLVRRDEAETESEGGIVLPDAAKNKPNRGEVVAVGEGKILDSGVRVSISVNVGDSVVFGAYGGTEVELNGDTYIILSESDILLVL